MQATENKVVMVAGGAGFVGSALVRELLATGAKVVSYDNYFHGTRANLEGVSGPFEAIEGDVLDTGHLTSVLESRGVSHVISCVGDTFVPDAYAYPERFFQINLLGTMSVLLACQRARTQRVLYVSSTEVYGVPPSRDGKLSEASELNPVNTYAVSKLAADRLCFTFHVEHGIPVVIARIFNAYGPRETHPYVVPEIISQLSRGSVVRLGNVVAERDLTFVHDTARGLIEVLSSDLPDGSAVNVGSGTTVSVRTLVETIAAIMERRGVEIVVEESRLRRYDIDRFCCDDTLIRSRTGWRPRVGLLEGLRATVTWFREHGERWPWELEEQQWAAP